MKDASVSLAGCCQTHCCSSPWLCIHPEPPPPSDYSSAAPSLRRSVSCPRCAHRGARTRSAQASHKQRRAEPTDKSCQKHTALQSDLHLPACLPASRRVRSIRATSDAKCLLMNLSWSDWCTDVSTSDSLSGHNDTTELMDAATTCNCCLKFT